MTPSERMETRANSLFDAGYTCSVLMDEVLTITSPQGSSYECDLERNTCECTSYKRNLRINGNPTCKHLMGGRQLALRISQQKAMDAQNILLGRLPWSLWAASGVRETRGNFLTWFEMPKRLPVGTLMSRIEIHNAWCEYIQLSVEADELALIAWPELKQARH